MRKIALLFPNLEYSNEVIDGIIGELEKYPVFTPIQIRYHCDFPLSVPENIDGVIGLTSPNLAWLPALLDRDLPFINCGTDLLDQKNVLSIYVDQLIAGNFALEHFRKLGLRRAWFSCYSLEKRSGVVRKATLFMDDARTAGFTTGLIEIPGEDPHSCPDRLLNDARSPELEKLLQEIPLPAGIFCEDDLAALLIQKSAHDLGIRVPADLAILGYSNQLGGRFAPHSISTFPMGGERVGRLAVTLMNEWLRTGSKPASPEPFAPLPIIVRESTTGSAGSLDLERIRRQIEKSACKGLGIDELCAMAGVSRKTLIVRYREAFGETPSEAIRRLRFERACTLLTDTQHHSLATIANECGFSSLTSFTNFFSRQAGMPPREYQKRKRKKSD